jgi:hypothetical protein
LALLSALTWTFVSPLQGEGRGFESLSAHQRFDLLEGDRLYKYRSGAQPSPVLRIVGRCQDRVGRGASASLGTARHVEVLEALVVREEAGDAPAG